MTIAVFSQIGLDDFVVYEGVRGNSFVRHTTLIMPEEAVRLETIEARHFFCLTLSIFFTDPPEKELQTPVLSASSR